MTIKKLIANGIVVAIVFITATFISKDINKPVKKNPNASSYPDQYVIGATLYDFTNTGKIKSILKSRKITHIKNKNTSNFANPNITTYTNKRTPWHIRANQGMTKDGTETVYLWGNTVIEQYSKNNELETTIKTNKVTWHTKSELITTKDKITLTRPEMRLTAQGMTVDLDNGVIKTQARSKGNYDQRKR